MLASGVPQNVVTGYEPYLTNLLGMKPRERERERERERVILVLIIFIGLVRGNIYYNLTNWYRCITCIPMIDNAK